MSGPTKLYQRAGSPLIHGRSRYTRSFWTQWALACLPAALVMYAVLAAATLLDPARPSLSSADAVLRWLALPAGGVVAMVPACALGVGVARAMGWHHEWLVGAVLGSIVGVGVMFYTRQLL